MLIGTVMLSKNTGCGSSTLRSPVQLLKVERATVLTEVSLIIIIMVIIIIIVIVIVIIVMIIIMIR